MRRDLRKYIAEYLRRYDGTEKDSFRVSDYQQIWQMSSGGSSGDLYYDLVFNGLMAGFMVGYKKAVRDERAKLQSGRRRNQKQSKTRRIEKIGVIDSDTGMITWNKK